MLSDNVNDYTSQMTFEEFQEWYKVYHHDCWLYDYGNCDVCDARKRKIVLAYKKAQLKERLENERKRKID